MPVYSAVPALCLPPTPGTRALACYRERGSVFHPKQLFPETPRWGIPFWEASIQKKASKRGWVCMLHTKVTFSKTVTYSRLPGLRKAWKYHARNGACVSLSLNSQQKEEVAIKNTSAQFLERQMTTHIPPRWWSIFHCTIRERKKLMFVEKVHF